MQKEFAATQHYWNIEFVRLLFLLLRGNEVF